MIHGLFLMPERCIEKTFAPCPAGHYHLTTIREGKTGRLVKKRPFQ